MKNKIGFCEWVMPIKGPSVFAIAAGLGADGVQIDDWGSYSQSFPMAEKRIQHLYTEEAKKCGMEIASMGCNGFSRAGGLVNRLGTPEGDISLLAIRTGIRTCVEMNVPLLMLPCCWDGYLRTEADIENASEMLRTVCKEAEEKNVTVAVETVLSPKKLKDMADYIGSSSFKIYYDTQNTQYFAGACPSEELRQIDVSDIAEVHFKEGLADVQGCRCFGEGETGFEESAEVLCRGGYEGWLMIENFYRKPAFKSGCRDVYEAMKRDVETLRRAFALW